MIFQSSYSREYSFLKKIRTQPTYLGYVCEVKSDPSLAERASLACAVPNARDHREGAGSASGLWMLGKEPVPFRLSLSAKCIVLYPTFLAKLMLVCFLLAWCVELVLCALHAGRTWEVA